MTAKKQTRQLAWATVATVSLTLFGCGPAAKPTSTAQQTKTTDPAKSERPPKPATSAVEKTPAVESTIDTYAENSAPTLDANDPAHRVDPAIRTLVLELAGTDSDKRLAARRQLGEDPDKTIAALIELATSKSAQLRLGAVFGLLGPFDPDRPQMVATMAAALEDDELSVRKIAVQAFSQQTPGFLVEYLPQLLKMLDTDTEDPTLRIKLTRTVKKMGRRAATAVPILSRVAREAANPRLRGQAMAALPSVSPDAASLLPTVVAVMHGDPDDKIRLQAIKLLSRLGPLSAPAVSDLLLLLQNQQASDLLRRAAADALSAVGPAAVYGLTELFAADDQATQVLAIMAVGNMGRFGRSAEPALRRMLKSTDTAVQHAAQMSLALLKS